MNTKPSLSQTKILTSATRFNDTHSRHRERLSISSIMKATKETTRIEISHQKTYASNYEDNFFSKMAIDFLAKKLQDSSEMGSNSSNKSTGYDNLVDTATRVSRNFDTKKQHELVLNGLDKAIPKPVLYLTKMLFPPSKYSRELFAQFTTIFFTWLIGPSVVIETEVDGSKEKSVVFIEKCRFLEQSNCVGMCTHLCKIPSQIFIKDSLGMPIYMKPDFSDLSCKMMFGQEPPELKDDPAMSQPCFKLCKLNKNTGVKH